MANRVEGLKQIQTSSTSGNIQSRRRVPTNPKAIPDAPRLRPQAAPVSTYVRPAQPDLNNPFTALASALESVNPAIAAITKKNKKDSYDEAVTFMGGKSHEEVMSAVRTGKAPQLENATGKQLFGKRQAFWRAEQLKFYYENEFDKEGGDLEGSIEAAIAEDIEAYGDDRMFSTNYFEVLQPELDKLRLGHNDFRQGQLMEERKDQIFDVWYQGSKRDFADGKAPEEVVKNIYSGFQTNKDFQRLSIKEQQGMLLDLARRNINDGNYSLARTMLTQEHSSDGITKSLVSDRELGQEATRLLSVLQEEQKKVLLKNEARTSEVSAKAYVQTQFMQGKASFLSDIELPDGRGGTTTYSAKQQRKDVALSYLRQSAEQDKRDGVSPEVSMDRELAALSQNGIKHPIWEETLKTGAMAASGATVSNEGELPPGLDEGYSLYSQLRAKSPRYLNSLLDDKSRQYYESVRIGQEYLKLDLQGAHLNAVQATANADAGETPYHRYRIDDLNRAVKDVTTKDLFLGIGTKMENGSNIADEVFSTAHYHMALGLTPNDALQASVETISGLYTNVGGWAIKLGDYGLPQNTPELMGELLDGYVEEHPAESLEREHLQIRPLGSGTGLWTIVDARTQSPVANRSTGKGIIRSEDILRYAEQREEKLRTEVSQASEGRYTPYYHSSLISIGPFKMEGFSEEEMKKIEAERLRLDEEHRPQFDADTERFNQMREAYTKKFAERSNFPVNWDFLLGDAKDEFIDPIDGKFRLPKYRKK